MNNVLNNILMQCGLIVPLEELKQTYWQKPVPNTLVMSRSYLKILKNWPIAM